MEKLTSRLKEKSDSEEILARNVIQLGQNLNELKTKLSVSDSRCTQLVSQYEELMLTSQELHRENDTLRTQHQAIVNDLESDPKQAFKESANSSQHNQSSHLHQSNNGSYQKGRSNKQQGCMRLPLTFDFEELHELVYSRATTFELAQSHAI